MSHTFRSPCKTPFLCRYAIPIAISCIICSGPGYTLVVPVRSVSLSSLATTGTYRKQTEVKPKEPLGTKVELTKAILSGSNGLQEHYQRPVLHVRTDEEPGWITRRTGRTQELEYVWVLE